MKKFFLAMTCALSTLSFVSCVSVNEAETVIDDLNKPLTPQETIETIKKIQKSVITVNFYLKYDKGQPPRIASGYRDDLDFVSDSMSGEYFIKDERPLKMTGYLMTPTEVLIGDPYIHPRFIKKISLSYGGEEKDAEISSYAVNESAMFLKFKTPFKDAVVVEVNPDAKSPYYYFSYDPDDYLKRSSLNPVGAPPLIYSNKTGQASRHLMINELIVNASGEIAGISMRLENKADGSNWKQSPLNWKRISSKEMSENIEKLKKTVDNGILRVRINFRSPKLSKNGGYRDRFRSEGQIDTELNAFGLLIDNKKLLVLADLLPKNTARLELLQVFVPGSSEAVNAKFLATLTDYGAFIAELEKPLDGRGLKFFTGDLLSCRDSFIFSAQVKLTGDELINYYLNDWLDYFRVGWKEQLYPAISSAADSSFIFNRNMELIAFPLKRRSKVSGSGYSESYSRLTPALYISKILSDLKKNSDPNNIPLSEKDQDRLAWMGVELQAMNYQLARANGVSDLTNNGRNGGLVTYVYPESPAAKAGIKPGYILLRLFADPDPQPMNPKIQDYRFQYPWDRIDTVPDKYYDKVPTPWAPIANGLNLMITEFGFGKKYRAEFYHDKKVQSYDFTVEKAPVHFDLADKFKDKKLGMTVCDMTYEAYRYYQMTNDKPGVVISSIQAGSKASISGLKPFEIIVSVNDKPVKNVKDFEKLIKGQKTLRLVVNRMSVTRTVKIELD